MKMNPHVILRAAAAGRRIPRVHRLYNRFRLNKTKQYEILRFAQDDSGESFFK
jgi:hypothetical protein